MGLTRPATTARECEEPGRIAPGPCSLSWFTAPAEPVLAVASAAHSPRTRLMMSVAMFGGTSMYMLNCIVYVARPWVRERRSVE